MSWQARLSQNLQELRFVFDSKLSNSKGVADFLSNYYPTLKVLNPRLPILFREQDDCESPELYCRYGILNFLLTILDYFQMESEPISNLTADEIMDHIKNFALKGTVMPKSDESKVWEDSVVFYSEYPTSDKWAQHYGYEKVNEPTLY